MENKQAQTVTAPEEYEMHLSLNGDMKERFKKAADLATELGLIESSQLKLLMSLYIKVGEEWLKQQWLAKMGYR